MTAAFQALANVLGIDEADLIDQDEVKAIAALIKRLQLKAAKVAEKYETGDTLAVLTAVEKGVDSLLGMDPQQARAYNHAVSIGQAAALPGVGQQSTNGYVPAALGSSASATDSPANALVEQFRQLAEADPTTATFLVGTLSDLGALRATNPANYELIAKAAGKIVGRDPEWTVVADHGQPVLTAVRDLRQDVQTSDARGRQARQVIDDLTANAIRPIDGALAVLDLAQQTPASVPPADQARDIARDLRQVKATIENANTTPASGSGGGRFGGGSRRPARP